LTYPQIAREERRLDDQDAADLGVRPIMKPDAFADSR
jgi:hypothetical protein